MPQKKERQPGERLGVLKGASREPTASLLDGDLNQVDLFPEVRVLFAGRETVRREEVDHLVAEARGAEERSERAQILRGVARFFAKLAPGRVFGVFAGFERSGGDLKQEPARGVAVLPHQHKLPFRVHGDDRDRSGMADDLAVHHRAVFIRPHRFLRLIEFHAQQAPGEGHAAVDQSWGNGGGLIRHEDMQCKGGQRGKIHGVMESSPIMTTRLMLLARLILFAPGLAQGQPEEVGKEALPLETEGYDLIYDYDFEEADALFQRLVDRFPDYAAGPFGRAITVYMRIAQQTGAMRGSSHRGDRFWDQTSKPEVSPEDVAIFEEGYAEAVARCESILARDPDNILALYYLGVTQSVKAAWEMTILRSYFGGSRAMRGAVKNHRRVREIDPDYADVYQVLGVYDYGIATLPRALRFLARLFGLRGEKERGIEWVARTAHEGNRSRWGALWALQLFMQREDRLDEALDAVRTLREKFPKNPDFALEEAGIHLHHGETAEAREELLSFIERRDAGFGNFNLAPGGLPELRLGETWLFEENWEEAEAAFSQGLQSLPPPDVRVMLHFRRGNARDGLGQRQPALFDYKRVRQLGGDKVVENWAKALRKRPWPAGAPEGARPHPEGEESHPH